MTTGSASGNRLTWQGVMGLLGLFAGLCTIFALVVSIAESWQEHQRAKWPQATARIQRCGVDQHEGFRGDSPRYTARITCRISYLVGNEEIITKISSRSVPSPHTGYWQYPTANIGSLQEWVDQHKVGSPIVVHYDPADHKHVVLTSTDMPFGGPRTPSNLKLLSIAATACVVLLTIAWAFRPRSQNAPAVASRRQANLSSS